MHITFRQELSGTTIWSCFWEDTSAEDSLRDFLSSVAHPYVALAAHYRWDADPATVSGALFELRLDNPLGGLTPDQLVELPGVTKIASFERRQPEEGAGA